MSIEGNGRQEVRLNGAEALSEQAAVRGVERLQQPVSPIGSTSVRSGGDTLAISTGARELIRAQQAVEAAPDVRADKVAEIKRQVDSGTYSVAPELLAKKLLGLSE